MKQLEIRICINLLEKLLLGFSAWDYCRQADHK